MKLSQRIRKIKKLEQGITVPYDVWRFYGTPVMSGDQIRFGNKKSDFGTYKEHQNAIKLLAKEFGMEVVVAEQPDCRVQTYTVNRSMTTWPDHVMNFLRFLSDTEGLGYHILPESIQYIQDCLDKYKERRVDEFNASQPKTL